MTRSSSPPSRATYRRYPLRREGFDDVGGPAADGLLARDAQRPLADEPDRVDHRAFDPRPHQVVAARQRVQHGPPVAREGADAALVGDLLQAAVARGAVRAPAVAAEVEPDLVAEAERRQVRRAGLGLDPDLVGDDVQHAVRRLEPPLEQLDRIRQLVSGAAAPGDHEHECQRGAFHSWRRYTGLRPALTSPTPLATGSPGNR